MDEKVLREVIVNLLKIRGIEDEKIEEFMDENLDNLNEEINEMICDIVNRTIDFDNL